MFLSLSLLFLISQVRRPFISQVRRPLRSQARRPRLSPARPPTTAHSSLLSQVCRPFICPACRLRLNSVPKFAPVDPVTLFQPGVPFPVPKRIVHRNIFNQSCRSVLSCLLGFLRSGLLLLSWPWRPFPSRLLLRLPRWTRFLSATLRGPLTPRPDQGGPLCFRHAQRGPQLPSLAHEGLLFLWIAPRGLLFLSLAHGGLLFLSVARGGLLFLSHAHRGPRSPISSPNNFFCGGSRAPAVVAGPSGEAKAT